MGFSHLIGLSKPEGHYSKMERIAVRAIIKKDKKILMVSNNKGDTKFPGGGVDSNESHIEALKREVSEETGFTVTSVIGDVGTVIERRKDMYKNDTYFEMTSYYYFCEVSDISANQSLDEYESKMEFIPEWIEIDKAIEKNELAMISSEKNSWVDRELYVLKLLNEK